MRLNSRCSPPTTGAVAIAAAIGPKGVRRCLLKGAAAYDIWGRERGENMKAARTRVAKTFSAKKVLVVDIGGTSVKILATGQTERRSPIRADLDPQALADD